MPFAVYILKLKHSVYKNNFCYYVGSWRGYNVHDRIDQHFRNEGSTWTKIHKPLSVVKIIDCETYREMMDLENKITKEYVFKFGYRHVRGGDFLNCRQEAYRYHRLKHGLTRIMKDTEFEEILSRWGPYDPEPPCELRFYEGLCF